MISRRSLPADRRRARTSCAGTAPALRRPRPKPGRTILASHARFACAELPLPVAPTIRCFRQHALSPKLSAASGLCRPFYILYIGLHSLSRLGDFSSRAAIARALGIAEESSMQQKHKTHHDPHCRGGRRRLGGRRLEGAARRLRRQRRAPRESPGLGREAWLSPSSCRPRHARAILHAWRAAPRHPQSVLLRHSRRIEHGPHSNAVPACSRGQPVGVDRAGARRLDARSPDRRDDRARPAHVVRRKQAPSPHASRPFSSHTTSRR